MRGRLGVFKTSGALFLAAANRREDAQYITGGNDSIHALLQEGSVAAVDEDMHMLVKVAVCVQELRTQVWINAAASHRATAAG